MSFFSNNKAFCTLHQLACIFSISNAALLMTVWREISHLAMPFCFFSYALSCEIEPPSTAEKNLQKTISKTSVYVPLTVVAVINICYYTVIIEVVCKSCQAVIML